MLKNIPFYASLLGQDLGGGKTATTSHVLVYGAIEVHAMGERGCIASNETIAKETGLTKQTVASQISRLAKAGWITVSLDDENHRTDIVPMFTIGLPRLTGIKGGVDLGQRPIGSGSNIEYIENTVENTDSSAIADGPTATAHGSASSKSGESRRPQATVASPKDSGSPKQTAPLAVAAPAADLGDTPAATAPGVAIHPAFTPLDAQAPPALQTVDDPSAAPAYGNPDINTAFAHWEERMGYAPSSKVTQNRRAASNLIKKHGIDAIIRVIDGVARLRQERYVRKEAKPANFIELQANWDAVMAAGLEMKNRGPKVVVI